MFVFGCLYLFFVLVRGLVVVLGGGKVRLFSVRRGFFSVFLYIIWKIRQVSLSFRIGRERSVIVRFSLNIRSCRCWQGTRNRGFYVRFFMGIFSVVLFLGLFFKKGGRRLVVVRLYIVYFFITRSVFRLVSTLVVISDRDRLRE